MKWSKKHSPFCQSNRETTEWREFSRHERHEMCGAGVVNECRDDSAISEQTFLYQVFVYVLEWLMKPHFRQKLGLGFLAAGRGHNTSQPWVTGLSRGAIYNWEWTWKLEAGSANRHARRVSNNPAWQAEEVLYGARLSVFCCSAKKSRLWGALAHLQLWRSPLEAQALLRVSSLECTWASDRLFGVWLLQLENSQ